MCRCNDTRTAKLVQASTHHQREHSIRKTAHTMTTDILQQFKGNDLQSSTQKYKLPTSKFEIHSLRLKVHHANIIEIICTGD